jgi:WhiB family redox-sensing transcriptional regulator
MCSQTDPEAFFPQENMDSDGNLIGSSYYDEAGAKALCDACPYKVECLKMAIEIQAEGIWGGTTAGERKLLVRRMKRAGRTLK